MKHGHFIQGLWVSEFRRAKCLKTERCFRYHNVTGRRQKNLCIVKGAIAQHIFFGPRKGYIFTENDKSGEIHCPLQARFRTNSRSESDHRCRNLMARELLVLSITSFVLLIPIPGIPERDLLIFNLILRKRRSPDCSSAAIRDAVCNACRAC